MDSCNSGSQSSSAGDEEYDSRAVNFSGYMTQPTNPLPPPQQPLFDSLSSYFLNQNTSWSRPVTPRSDPNTLMNTFISSFQPSSFVGAQNNNSNLTAAQNPPSNQNQLAARNPKKRSRASRRAPTTVLTTDTTNFRAMVQEFTGIPAPPFNNSPYQRTRLDLFGGRSNFSDAAPPLLLRPFAQKAHPPPQMVAQPQSSFLVASSSTTNSVSSNDIPITQSSNIFNISSNPFLQQSNPKFPFSDSSSLEMGSKNQFSDHLNSVKLGGFGDFSLGRHGNLVTSVINQPIPSTYTGTASQRNTTPNMQNDVLNDNNNSSSNVGSWGSNPVRREDSIPYQTQQINENFEFSRNMSTIMTSYNEKVILENNNNGVGVATRGEGMVESWINCTNSD